MSLGFGFGLPHYVAVLGGGGPPATVYFLSLTTSTDTDPYSVVVDSSGNIEFFGYNQTGNNGLAAKLTSSGTQSLFKGVYTDGVNGGGVATGSIDSSDNIYITYVIYGGCSSYYPIIAKTNTSFGVVASKSIDFGGNAGYFSKITVDNSGNLWAGISDSYYNYLIKFNSTLTSASTYISSSVCCAYSVSPYELTLAPSGNLIIRGAYYTPACCTYVSSPMVQSITTSGVLNWTQVITLAGVYSQTLAVDSSGNIYFTFSNYLAKLNSSGVIQWTSNAKQYTNISQIISMALDSSGNVYCIGPNAVTSSVLEIIKVNSAGVIQFSNRLSVTSGGNLTLSSPSIAVNNGTMYITTTTAPPVGAGRATVLKVPTDGTLTQTIVVGSVTYSYASSGVTSSDVAITGSLTTNYPYGSAAPATLAAYTPSISDVTATTAVTPL